jgi:hypothetical protein
LAQPQIHQNLLLLLLLLGTAATCRQHAPLLVLQHLIPSAPRKCHSHCHPPPPPPPVTPCSTMLLSVQQRPPSPSHLLLLVVRHLLVDCLAALALLSLPCARMLSHLLPLLPQPLPSLQTALLLPLTSLVAATATAAPFSP